MRRPLPSTDRPHGRANTLYTRTLRAGVAALCLLAALCLPTVPGPAGEALAQAPPRFEEEVSIAYVLVPVTVRGRRGYVEELERDDFRLTVDGRRVPIESFDAEASTPVSLVWLQDLSGSMDTEGKLEASRRALDYFLERSRPDDGFAIATFAGGRINVEVPFTDNVATLREAMNLWEGYGTTALYDAVAWVPELSATGDNPRRAVMLITDGIDNASAMPAATAGAVIRYAEVPVYAIGLGRPIVPVDGDEEGIYRYAQLLERLADTTGGRYFHVTSVDGVDDVAEAVHEELRRQYVLGFPALTSDRDGVREYHRIEVEVVGRSEAEVVHRAGYQGGPPESSVKGAR